MIVTSLRCLESGHYSLEPLMRVRYLIFRSFWRFKIVANGNSVCGNLPCPFLSLLELDTYEADQILDTITTLTITSWQATAACDCLDALGGKTTKLGAA